jgi:SPX domain protein involved in polyphosphate accumulation
MKPRIEQKLHFHRTDYPGFLRWMQNNGGTVLHPDRSIHSTYFDSVGLQMFRDTEEGVVPRKKVRIRCYGSHGPECPADHFAEVKQTTERQRLKETRRCDDWQHLHDIGIDDSQYGVCRPVVGVSYRRSYYELLGVRVTVDQDITYHSADTFSITQQSVSDPSIAIEIKAPAQTDLDYLSTSFPFPRIHFSKYERAVLAVKPKRL